MQQIPNGSVVNISTVGTSGKVVGWAEGASADTGDDLYCVEYEHPNALVRMGPPGADGVAPSVYGSKLITSWFPVSMLSVVE